MPGQVSPADREKRIDDLAARLRWLVPVATGAVGGALQEPIALLGWTAGIGALVGLTIAYIVHRLDIERNGAAITAGAIGSVLGAPAASYLLVMGLGTGAWAAALAAGFGGWIIGCLLGGFIAIIIWFIVDLFG